MIDLTINETVLDRVIERAKERNIIIPTFEQQKNDKYVKNDHFLNKMITTIAQNTGNY